MLSLYLQVEGPSRVSYAVKKPGLRAGIEAMVDHFALDHSVHCVLAAIDKSVEAY
jgi:hypothetical protein